LFQLFEKRGTGDSNGTDAVACGRLLLVSIGDLSF